MARKPVTEPQAFIGLSFITRDGEAPAPNVVVCGTSQPDAEKRARELVPAGYRLHTVVPIQMVYTDRLLSGLDAPPAKAGKLLR